MIGIMDGETMSLKSLLSKTKQKKIIEMSFFSHDILYSIFYKNNISKP